MWGEFIIREYATSKLHVVFPQKEEKENYMLSFLKRNYMLSDEVRSISFKKN